MVDGAEGQSVLCDPLALVHVAALDVDEASSTKVTDCDDGVRSLIVDDMVDYAHYGCVQVLEAIEITTKYEAGFIELSLSVFLCHL